MSKPNRFVDKRTEELIAQTQSIPIEVIEKAIKQSLIGDNHKKISHAEVEVKTKKTIEKENQPYTVIDETTPGVSIILSKSKKRKPTVKVTRKFCADRSTCRTVKSRVRKRRRTRSGFLDSHRRFNTMMLTGTMAVLFLVMVVPVQRTIAIIDGAQPPKHIVTSQTDVESILNEKGITLGEEDAIIDDKKRISATGDVIRIMRVTYEEEIENVEVAYAEELIEDPLLFEGDVRVLSEGVPGVQEVVHRKRFINEEFDSKETIAKDIVPPVNKVVSVGTRVKIEQEWSSGQMTGYSGNCSASGYCGSHIYNGSLGNDLRIVAAPSDIPFCTIMEFTDLSIPDMPKTIQAIVLERGSAIHGSVFDLLQPDFASSASVGRQHMQYRILEIGSGNRSCWQ